MEQVARAHGALLVAGDARTGSCLRSMQLERAREAVLLTGDDLVNLDAAWRIAEMAPDLPVTAHVSDLGLWRTIDAVRANGVGDRVRIFNAHRVAAHRLYEEHLAAYFATTEPEDVVVLLGFGRFGQTVLEYLQRRAGSQIKQAVVVDRAAGRRARLYEAQVGNGGRCDLVVVEGDLDDPHTFEHIDATLEMSEAPPVFVIGTDDDQRNLRSAITLRSSYPDSRIFVRCVHQSAFGARISTTLRFEVLAVDAMLRHALAEEPTSWTR